MFPMPQTDLKTQTRLRRIEVSTQFLVEWIHFLSQVRTNPAEWYQTRLSCDQDFPADALVVGVYPGTPARPHVVTLLVYSETFEPVSEGDVIPCLSIIFRSERI